MLALRNHADGRVQQPDTISYLLECIAIQPDRLMNLLIPRRLVGDTCEKLLQAWSCCEPQESIDPLLRSFGGHSTRLPWPCGRDRLRFDRDGIETKCTDDQDLLCQRLLSYAE